MLRRFNQTKNSRPRFTIAAPFLATAAIALLLFAGLKAAAQFAPSQAPSQTPTKPLITQEIQLTGDTLWLDTNIDIVPGEHLVFSASGSLQYPDAKSDNSPEGLPRSYKDLIRNFPLNNAGRGALIARIGDPRADNDTVFPFLLGSKRELDSPVAGRLFVGINQTSNDTASGTYRVQITIYPQSAKSTFHLARIAITLPGIDNSLFAKIPRRVADKSGDSGDMINFLIIGSQAAVEKIFASAGWVRVDSSVDESILNGVIATISKESYLTMPMSQLYLFRRPQDYGWAHAEPIQVVASRHHLRLWKAPFTVDGETVWLGAATHDIGFAHDDRSNNLTSITHKIDPDVDLERDYVQKTLTGTGQVAAISHFLPVDPVKTAITATGASFHSNGQVLILRLVPATPTS
jgi:hypothetical protein